MCLLCYRKRTRVVNSAYRWIAINTQAGLLCKLRSKYKRRGSVSVPCCCTVGAVSADALLGLTSRSSLQIATEATHRRFSSLPGKQLAEPQPEPPKVEFEWTVDSDHDDDCIVSRVRRSFSATHSLARHRIERQKCVSR